MKKAILIAILCTVMLTACTNGSKSAESAETPEVSQTATAVTASAVTSAREEKDTSEITTTTKNSLQRVSETSKAKTTTKSTVSSSAVSTHIPREQNQQQSYSQTEQMQANTQINTTQKPAVTITQQKQTAAKPATVAQKPQTTASKPVTKPESTVTWTNSMKVWRKLCEGKSLSGKEQNLIRSEILEYAKRFNGKKNIHVSFGIDKLDISYEKPLNLIIRNDMTDLSYAHMDAYVDADSRWLIEDAKNEKEIYGIVSKTRADCLHVIDYGLYNRWEIYGGNNALKYASDIEFNVGFDDTAIWFLTED